VVVVHNGIIENYLDLKEQLIRRGTKFSSETDTEIVAHLVAEKIDQGMDFLEAVRKSLREIQGSYALLFLNQRDPKRLIVAKNSTPIVIGGVKGTFIASGYSALLDYTRKVAFLEDGEVAEVSADSFRLLTAKVNRFTGLSKKSPGTRWRRARAAIAILCSKRFTISRGPWRTHFGAASL
jgi:glucosamine--fructose-6-phosphate aminotransferase (isomerizing)